MANISCYHIKTIKQIRGFCPTTYAVFKGSELLKIFLKRSEAQDYIARSRKAEATEATEAPDI